MFKRVNVSLDHDLVKKVDKDRGDIPRSKFLQRIIERHYGVVAK